MSTANTYFKTYILIVLNTYSAFCHDDNFLTTLSKLIDSRTLTKMINFQFENNMISMKTNVTPPTDDWR